jgi:hypothetical protein
LLAAVVLAAAGCGSRPHATQTTRQRGIPRLRSVDQLRHTFDAHPGEPRLILLISPT